MSVNIHPTAIVDKTAELGANVQIGPYSIICADTVIGDNCKLIANVYVDRLTRIDSDNIFHPYTSVGTPPQDLKYHDEPSYLVMGKNNTVREFVTLHRGTESGRMQTSIGSHNLFMANSHVAHDCKIGDYNILANSVGLAGHVELTNRAIVGGMVGIHQFVRVGEYVMISAGSMVGQDVPPYSMVQGDRAKLRGINTIGLARAKFTPEQIGEIKQVYRQLFTHLGSLTKKLETIPLELQNKPHIKLVIDFISASKRGVISSSNFNSGEDS